MPLPERYYDEWPFRSKVVADDMSWIALIPLVASVQAGEYSTVNFYENGEFLTSVPLAR